MKSKKDKETQEENLIYLPYLDMVITMRLFGLSEDEILNFLAEDRNELRRLYKKYLKINPLEDKNKAVEFALFYSAVSKKSVDAMKYWLEKNYPDKYSKNQKEKEIDYDDLLKVIANNLPD